MTDAPQDPITQLAESAALHEMYRAYVDAGFTETQAFELVQSAIAAMWGNANS
ncbi:MAG: hypothetical protein ACRDP4_14460 [Nocardioidaceae bacterium]